MRTLQLPLAASLALALSSCAHAVHEPPAKSGSANFKVFIPQGAPMLDVPRNQAVAVGNAFEQADPEYPAQLLRQDIPAQAVCLTVAINAQGEVYKEHPLYGLPGCPANAQAVDPAFVAAARSAVSHWYFLPTLLCTFKPGVDAQKRPCPDDDATSQPIAISLAFVFTFTQVDGKPRVRSGRLPARP